MTKHGFRPVICNHTQTKKDKNIATVLHLTVSVERNVKIIEVFADDEATSKTYVPKSTNVQTVPVSRPPQPSTQEKPEELRHFSRQSKPSELVQQLAAGEYTTGGDDEEVCTADHTTTIMDTKEDIILVAGAETELSIIESDPKSLQEARVRPDWPQWKKAMDKEI